MSLRVAIVNSENKVENIALWDGVTPWQPCHEDDELVLVEGVPVDLGWIYDGLNFSVPPPAPAPEPTAEDLAKASARAKLADLGLTDEEIAALVG